MSKSKGRRLAEWLRDLDSNSKASSNTLADNSVNTSKLVDDAVTSAKIANSAVATDHLADTGVTFGKLHTALVVTESDGISSNDNDATIATSAAIIDHVATEVAALVDSAPGTLNTLNELAAALNDDASFSTTITDSIALKAPLASPALTGTPTAPTASSGTNTTQLATTAFVTAATSGLATDSNVANKAPLNSPTFTGTPAAPTASAGTNTTQLATTAFVTAAVASGGGGVDGISSSADATVITITSNEKVTIDPAGSSQVTHELSVREQDSPRITIDDIGGSDTDVNAALLLRAGVTNKGVVGYVGSDNLHVENKTASGSVVLGTNDISRLIVDSSGTVSLQNGSGLNTNGNLTLTASSSGDEGGQINFNTVTGGVASGTMSIDAWQDNMRFLNGTTAGDFYWYTASNAAIGMTLTGSGKLGIGETSPETPIHIKTANTLGSTFTGSTRGEGITVEQTSYTNGNYISLIEGVLQDGGLPTARIGVKFTGSGSTLTFGTSNSYATGITNTALTIDPSSNVAVAGQLTINNIPAAPSSWQNVLLHQSGVVKADTAVQIHGSGYLKAAYLNMSHAVATRSSDTTFFSSTDDYIRKNNATGFRASLGIGTSNTPTFAGIARNGHNTGHLVGSYNSVGANSTASNPIYTIGSNYNPNILTLGNMYGIGFTKTSASFIGLGASNSWGLYVAADGDARVWLGGSSGEIIGTGNITAYASDARLKTNVVSIKNAIDKVKKIRGVTFDWVDNITSEYDFHPASMHEHGVIAQEIQEVIPDAVVTAPFNGNYAMKTGTDHNFLTVDKDKIVPLLIEAIKEQQEQIEELKERIDASSN